MTDAVIAKFYRLILAGLVTACLVYHAAILWESRERIAAGYGDFIIFYTGAQIINDGRSKELFKIETQDAYQAKFDVPQLEWPMPFNHAPYELLPFLPVARLSYTAAHAVWSGLNLVLLMVMLGWLLRYVDSPHRFFIAAAALAWFPTMEAFRQGQDSIMSAALLLAVFVALKRGADSWAGVFLALGLYKPQLVLPMAGGFLVARRWRTLLAFSVTGGILVAVSLAMVGWQGAVDLIEILRSMGRYSYIVYPPNMPNVRGLFHVLLDPKAFPTAIGFLTIVISLSLYAFCLYFWRQDWNTGDPGFDLKYSLIIVTTVLVSYHLYSHDLFPLVLPLVLMFRYFGSGTSSDSLPGKTFFLLVLVLLLPILPRYLIGFRIFGWGALAILICYVVVALEIVRQCFPGRPQPITLSRNDSPGSFGARC
jgi:hypothetical protein